jgi:uncharacterized protein
MVCRDVYAVFVIMLLCLSGCASQAPLERGDGAEADEARRQLISAIRNGDAEEVGRQIRAGAEVNVEGGNHTRPIPIVLAARKGDPTVMAQLMEAGADVNVRDAMGATPLMHAAWEGHAEIVRMLLQAGVEVDAQSAEGVTALEAAREREQTEVVEILLQAGAQDREPLGSPGGSAH